MTGFMLILIAFLIVELPSGHDGIDADSHSFFHCYTALRA